MARKTTSISKAAPRRQISGRKDTTLAKHQKPLFQTGTLFSVLLLAGLIGLAYYLNNGKKSVLETVPTDQFSFVFTETDGNPLSIDVKNASGDTVKLARTEENIWTIVLPFEAEADQGLAEAAASQISALQVISSIDAEPDIFGLDNPAYIITIEFEGGQKHTLEIGDSTPTNSGYYVRVDKDKMMITDLSGIDSLIRLGNFPPYLNTPTPSPLPPTETPVSSTDAFSTPQGTVTPAP